MDPDLQSTIFRTRESSPSPSVSPSSALLACPPLDRSFSTASSASSFSADSSTSSSSTGSATSRRRGYVRPQGAAFAESARNRESVMSLGSIAHLQYYFARTGLLDGKGGQIAKPRKDDGLRGQSTPGKGPASALVRSSSQLVCQRDTSSLGGELVDSPLEEQDWQDQEQVMLPPTVSTYSHRVQHIPPPPDTEALREDLRQALEQARQAMVEIQVQQVACVDWWGGPEDGVRSDKKIHRTSSESPPSQGMHELQGIHLLDIVTLAIRAARIYYTAHDHLERLTSIRSERKIREELFTVLDVLKRMAARNFAGGLKGEERTVIDNWILQVEELLVQEQEKERVEQRERESWPWLKGDWFGQEHEREFLFINSFLTDVNHLPGWDPPTQADRLPTPFLSACQSGLLLVRLHNVLVQKSKRHFGDIKTFHTDTAKPYRRAENLRYWAKAAEIRWETKFTIDVTGIVHGQSDKAWKDFDCAILTWCKVIREELTREWTEAVSKERTAHNNAWIPPQLRFEMDEPSLRS